MNKIDMNKIDFKKIKNQFDSSINLLDDSIYNGGVFSFSSCLDNVDPNQLVANPNFHLDPIFFSDLDSSFLAFKKEKVFSFSNREELESLEEKISNFIQDTSFINKETKNQKTFIFGGYAFNIDSINDGLWSGIPIGNFILPRYIFYNSKLIINFFSDSKLDKNNIQKTLYHYISNLEELCNKKESHVKNKLKKIIDYTDKNIYLSCLNKTINYLNKENTNLDKVVLSRIKKASFKSKVSTVDIIIRLLKNNHNAMNFLYSIDNNAHIIGSTPELILEMNNNKIVSEALAGSNYNLSDEEFSSNNKEFIEQKIVSDYIINIFNQCATDVTYNEKPFIKRTSNIDHLCTSISGTINSDETIFSLLRALHPSPAISGFPIEGAINKISLMKESRGWYGGPIGWIDNDLNGKFFLNIRSGLILGNDMYLFSGSGIIKNSNINSEWQETEQKFNLMIESIK